MKLKLTKKVGNQQTKPTKQIVPLEQNQQEALLQEELNLQAQPTQPGPQQQIQREPQQEEHQQEEQTEPLKPKPRTASQPKESKNKHNYLHPEFKNANLNPAEFTDSPRGKDTFYKVLVVDIGSMYVKYMLIVNYNGTKDFVLKTEIKDFDNFNYHLFSRDLKRKIDKYSVFGLDKVIILPRKNVCQPLPLPRFEYREGMNKIRDEVKKEFRTSLGNLIKMSYDWTIMVDAPEDDYQSIFIESIPETELHQLGNSLVSLGLKDFVVGSPFVGYAYLTDDAKPHIVVDVGDTATSLMVVKEGAIYSHVTVNVGGSSITNSLTERSQSPQEALIFKKNSTYRELGDAVDSLTESIKGQILKLQSDYEKQFRDRISDYIIVGGSASLEFEEELSYSTIGLDRYYPKMELENDDKIPNETRNYFFSCYSSYKYYKSLSFKGKNGINLMASKAGSFGLVIKDILQFYNRYNVLMYSVACIWVLLAAFYIYNYQKTTDTSTQLKVLVNQYKTKSNTLNTQQTQLTNENKSVIEEAVLRKGKNTGDLLHKMGDLSGADISIRGINMVNDGELTYIEISSTSQKSISNYLVLLTESCFDRANIDKVVVEDANGETIYKSTVKAQGRKI